MRPNNARPPMSRVSLFTLLFELSAFVRTNLVALGVIFILLGLPFVVRLIPGALADTSTPISIATFGGAVPENFNTLASSSTSSTTPTGFGFVEAGSNANTSYTAGTGSGNAGDTYSFGAASNTERAFGGLQSGTLIPTIGASFTNNTGGTITSLDISYTGEQWRIGNTLAARDDRLDFQYSLDATTLSTGTWTDVNALDFTNIVKTALTAGPLDGNNAANRIAISNSISGLSIANGATFFIRWTDFNATGADDGLAVDDFSLTANGNPGDTAPMVNNTIPANGATNVAPDANISITFSENVDVGSSWFEIACATSGVRQVTDTVVSGGPLTFTIDPNTDFAGSETCTVTVFSTQVSDQDSSDPPDQMESNAVFSFTVATPPP
ncbi:MAG: Ig-like domain-containing protein, partial [Pyrinomonadaceae bacterium]